jgi:hypothetical protein
VLAMSELEALQYSHEAQCASQILNKALEPRSTVCSKGLNLKLYSIAMKHSVPRKVRSSIAMKDHLQYHDLKSIYRTRFMFERMVEKFFPTHSNTGNTILREFVLKFFNRGSP